MVISSQTFDPLKRHSNATKGTNSRLGWTKYSDLHEIVHSSLRQPCVIRSLSNYHYDDDNVKKQFVLRAKQLLCTCITLLSTFDVHCKYDVKPPNCPFSIWTGIKSLRIQLNENSPTLIDELLGFKSDVFTVVVVVVA